MEHKAIKRPSQLYSLLSRVRSLEEVKELLSRLDGKFSVFRFTRADAYGWEVWWRSRKIFYIVVRDGRVTVYRVFKDTDYFPEVHGIKVHEFKVVS